MDQVAAQQGAAPPGTKPMKPESFQAARNTLDADTTIGARATSLPPPFFGDDESATGNGAVKPHLYEGNLKPAVMKTRSEIFRGSLLAGSSGSDQHVGAAVLGEATKLAGRAPPSIGERAEGYVPSMGPYT